MTTVAVLLLGACGGGSEPPVEPEQAARDSFSHVHGLGVNPADEALFVATHDGLFRAAKAEDQLERVGASRQDTMGFTVVSESTCTSSVSATG